MTLLRTKIHIPPPRPDLVARPRLIDRLDAGLDLGHRLTLIAAPAGYGKSTLLSAWVAGLDCPVAWVSLDEGDSDPARFWSTVVAALQTLPSLAGSTVLETLLAALQATQRPPLEALLTALVNELAARPQAFLLVLDDYHAIKAQAVHDSVAFLLSNLPPPPQAPHLVLAGRSDPPLPLARLRGRGQLTELRIADLRFTEEEVAALLRDVARLPVSADEIAALEARTEGWVTGLQLAAIALQAAASEQHSDVPRFIQQFTGSHRFVLDYLVEEVFAQQPLTTKRFLLETSLLDRLAGPLCDAVCSAPGGDGSPLDGQATLEALERANLFIVPLDAARRWYRYHRLFADLLRSRLERLGSQLGCSPAGELHRRASIWYEVEGFLAEAMGHALASSDPTRAADLIQSHGLELLKRGEMTTLLGWLASLPAGTIRSKPQLSIYQAWALALSGHSQDVEPSLQAAETATDDGPTDRRGQVAAIRAYVSGHRGEIARAVDLAHSALAQLDEGNLVVRSVVLFTLANTHLARGNLAAAAGTLAQARDMGQAAGNIHLAVPASTQLADLKMHQGQLHAAYDAYRRALDMAGQSPVAAQAHSGMGAVSYEWNDLEVAAQHLARSIELGRLWGNADALSSDYVTLAWIRWAQGDLQGAQDAGQGAQRCVGSHGLQPAAAARVSAGQVRLALAQGDLQAAERWVRDSGLGLEGEIPPLRTAEYALLARALLALGQAETSSRLLARLREATETAGMLGQSIEILLLQALAFRAQGDPQGALAALDKAVSLAAPEGYVRTFLDEGAPLQSLLLDLRSRVADQVDALGEPGSPSLLAYMDGLLAAFPSAGKREPPRPAAGPAPAPGLGWVEPLSKRELEVLRLVAAGLTNQAIADRLFIALSTVKSHTNSIYGKLGVQSRTQAIAKAMALGLLQPRL